MLERSSDIRNTFRFMPKGVHIISDRFSINMNYNGKVQWILKKNREKTVTEEELRSIPNNGFGF